MYTQLDYGEKMNIVIVNLKITIFKYAINGIITFPLFFSIPQIFQNEHAIAVVEYALFFNNHVFTSNFILSHLFWFVMCLQ